MHKRIHSISFYSKLLNKLSERNTNLPSTFKLQIQQFWQGLPLWRKKNSLPDLPNYFISKIYLQEYIYYDHSLVISVYSCIAYFKKVIFKSKSLATPGGFTLRRPQPANFLEISVAEAADPGIFLLWIRIREFRSDPDPFFF